MAMKSSLLSTVSAAAVALTALCGAAGAEERKLDWSVTFAGTSDYIFRGLSFNDEKPAFQPGVNFSYGMVYWGYWGSNLPGDSPWENDFLFGIKPSLGPVSFDFGGVYYAYFNTSDSDYVELKAGASWSPVSKLTLGSTFWYVPDQSHADEQISIEGTVAYELPSVSIFTPSVSGLVGYTEATDTPDFYKPGEDGYTYWNAGLTLAVDKFSFDFRYWDTNLDSAPGDTWHGLDDERFVFTTSVMLP